MTISQQQPPATSLDDHVRSLRHQTDVLSKLGYPALADLTEAEFRARVSPLEDRLGDLPAPSHHDSIPFLLIMTRTVVPPEAAVGLIDVRGKEGWTDMESDELAGFTPIDAVTLPEASAYLLADVDTGKAFLNVRPMHALPRILEQGRSPLTIDEGIALMLQFPEILQTHNAFQLLASRCGDKRVPAVWMSYGRPRLGWCWDGNPHSWLGMASAAARLG